LALAAGFLPVGFATFAFAAFLGLSFFAIRTSPDASVGVPFQICQFFRSLGFTADRAGDIPSAS
jgi:hypothetical protein